MAQELFEYRCLLLDFRGHGESEHVAPAAYNPEHHAEDLVEVVPELVQSPYAILAHSAGALAAARFMTHTPPTVTDELSATLLDALGPAGLLELTSFIALANYYARSNVAVGIEAAGLAASCRLEPVDSLPALLLARHSAHGSNRNSLGIDTAKSG